MQEFFDKHGNAVCYLVNSRLYSWAGTPLGTVSSDKVHDLSGAFLGWIKRGYFLNEDGRCSLFTEFKAPRQGAPLPARRPKKAKGARGTFPELAPKMPAPPFNGIVPTWADHPFKAIYKKEVLGI